MAVTKKKGTNKKNGLCKPGISGDMTIYAAETIKHDLDALINDYERYEFDLSEVEEIDTSGIQILLAAARHLRQQGKSFVIIKSNEEVNRLLDSYQLQSVLCEGA